MWFTERETENLHVRHHVESVLYKGRSEFQEIEVIDTSEFGRMLVLDGVIQTTVRDEFIYHEMLAHVPLLSHQRPERVLVIGGGDGGTVREVLKHPEVKRVHLVEIDEMVIRVCQEHLPELAEQLGNPRVSIHIDDGCAFVQERVQYFDVVLVDSTDPVGPGTALFSSGFYGHVARALRRDGILALQCGSPFFGPEQLQEVYRRVADHFTTTRLYLASVPTYSIAPWAFILAANGAVDPAPHRQMPSLKTRFYSPEVHRAAFVLPPYVKQLLASAVSTGASTAYAQ